MYFTRLILRQFRNLSSLDLDLRSGLTIFVGANGAGKSNILEGLSLLASGQSHRGAETRYWIQEGKEESALIAQVEGEESLALDFKQKRGKARQFRVNNLSFVRQKDWAGKIPLVSFSPDELDLVKGEPSVRGRMLNAVLSQSDPRYAETLSRYTKTLEERNAALRLIRDGQAKPEVLVPWTLSLVREGVCLTMARNLFLKDFGSRVEKRWADLSRGRDRGGVFYRPSFAMTDDVASMEDNCHRRLAELKNGEIALGSTLAGPHRDDVELRLDNDVARVRASQGQSRTLALAWKWEEKFFLRERLGREPVSILDDVFSELDPERRAQLTDLMVSGGQCFLSLTDFSVWGTDPSLSGARVVGVAGGVVVSS